MRESLSRWVSEADALRHHQYFGFATVPPQLSQIRERQNDYYLSLVGELFERMRDGYPDAMQWARLADAFSQFVIDPREPNLRNADVDPDEALLYAAAAFYCGGYPASAYLTIQRIASTEGTEPLRACFDLLATPATPRSAIGQSLQNALRRGDLPAVESIRQAASRAAAETLELGPNEWIGARLLELLLTRFTKMNVRAVLPRGDSSFWDRLVSSFLQRTPPVWVFFPSQIEAIKRGLLDSAETYSLQMPTGAGKTALCETLLYRHLERDPDSAAVLLVPYRSIASELRSTLVKRLNSIGISARCAYGGTVPLGDEVRELDQARAIVATPEAIAGLLSAAHGFLQRISLVVCDEGHLLDAPSRGIGLELLLARIKAREGSAPRFVFVSAIVPNIEEINAWLGGTAESVVRSDYRPALAEFAVMHASKPGRTSPIILHMHPHEPTTTRYYIPDFLSRGDFEWFNEETGRRNTMPFNTVKRQAIAAARKALPMGAAAVFAANKRGDQGAVGLAEELLDQLRQPLTLPQPIAFADAIPIRAALEYLAREYGNEWIGTRALAAGAVLHHGDIPQETREVLETLLRRGNAKFAICTTTLAEGVNFPIRTLVLYSVQRRQKGGQAVNLLTRDIKNLVGRAGRAGATTKGLVICANAKQWHLVEQVARQATGEPVTGSLRSLLDRVKQVLATRNAKLTNPVLENNAVFHTMIDGIDATLIDLASEEIGEEALVQLATQVAHQTFAARQADVDSQKLLENVFELRARRIVAIRTAGRIAWVRETGAHPRMLESVESSLMPLRDAWDDIADPTDPSLLDSVMAWAWSRAELQDAIREAYHLDDDADTAAVRPVFHNMVIRWLSGSPFIEIATNSNMTVDLTLSLHAIAQAFILQTLVEQGLALLGKLLESQGKMLAPAVKLFPEYLRFGVPSEAARILASEGLRHRQAAVSLGAALDAVPLGSQNGQAIFRAAHQLISNAPSHWKMKLGTLVFENTTQDLGFD